MTDDITDEQLAKADWLVWRIHEYGAAEADVDLLRRFIAALRACRELRGAAVEAMRDCMKDLQEHGVIFAPGDPPYDVLVAYDEETG